MQSRLKRLWLLLLVSAIPSGAQEAKESSSAWKNLVLGHPEIVQQLTPLEREILQLLTPAQLDRYVSGVDASQIILPTGEALSALLLRKGAGSLDIPWHSIDGGGGTSSGGDFVLNGTIGQLDAGTVAMVGGQFSLTGGFWAAQGSSGIFSDGFETGDTGNWSNVVP